MVSQQLFQAAHTLGHRARRYAGIAHATGSFLTPAECLVRCRNTEGIICGQAAAGNCDQANRLAGRECFANGTRPSVCTVISETATP